MAAPSKGIRGPGTRSGSTSGVEVVGLSDKPDRDSYRVAEYLQRQGYRIIPVNPTVDAVLGEKSYASVSDIPARFARRRHPSGHRR